jgi:hypothetical protein
MSEVSCSGSGATCSCGIRRSSGGRTVRGESPPSSPP